jgi:Zn-dependent protease
MSVVSGETEGVWVDGHRRSWTVQLLPGRVVLTSDDRTVDIAADDWARDVSVAEYGTGFIIRFSTADEEIGFIAPQNQANPLLEHIGYGQPDSTQIDIEINDDHPAAGLNFPRVSSLAIGALMTSSLAFVPGVGLIAAGVTIVLLLLHRKRVRPSAAWDHSRRVCLAAVLFLVTGLVTQAVTVVGINRFANATGADDGRLYIDSAHVSATLTHDSSAVLVDDGGATLVGEDVGRASVVAQSGGFFGRQINWAMLVAGLIVVIMSLSVHEAAHAVTALWLGDDFARRAGRVTLNPISHIDPFGTVLLPAILFIANAGVFGWARPVPVLVDRLRRPRRDHILVSAAGPASNLLLAAASLSALLFLGVVVALAIPDARVTGFASADFSTTVKAEGFAMAPVFGALCTMLKLSFVVNVFLAFFNLIPVPPLDGSWILQNLFHRTLGPFFDRIRPYGFIIFLLLIYSNALRYLLAPVREVLGPGFLLLDLSTPYF